MAETKVQNLENWANQASKKVAMSGLKATGKGILYGFRNPWVWVVVTAWTALPVEAQEWVMKKVEQGLGYTFDTFEDFYDWMVSDEDGAKIVADYVNQSTGAPDGVFEQAPPALMEQIPTKDAEALAMLWQKRNGSGQIMPMAQSRQNPVTTMKLSAHHVAEAKRLSVTKRMQSTFNVKGVLATRQLHQDLNAFVNMSEDELDGAISALLIAQ
jgi:hypothetical protein